MCPRRLLVGAHDRASAIVADPIEVAAGIRLRLEGVQHPWEPAGLLPAIEAAGHRLPRAIALREVPPGRAGAQEPYDAVENGAMGMGGPPRFRFLRGEQRLPPLPWPISYIPSVPVASPPSLSENRATCSAVANTP